jgi:hypothetical protein
MGKKKNAYKMLVGKPEGKRPLGRPRHRWVDNIKMEREMGWDGMVWTRSIWLGIGPVEGSCEHGNEPLHSVKCWEVLK